MSWQRIDENTYIDDTLVTCAEYQLFIEEMFEQGRFYQPDHWTSHQFSSGQAREPILGIRHSDAKAFCEWLTERESREEKYRQPTQEEARHFPMKVLEKGPTGYWLNKKFEFANISSLSKDARKINIDTLTSALDLASALNRDRSRALFFDLALSLKLARDRAQELAHSLAHTVDRNLPRPTDLDRDRDYAHALIRALYVARGLDHPLDLKQDLATTVSKVIKRPLDLERTLVSSQEHILDINLDRDLSRGLGIYIDIFTLQERIAGRSPAFEGIRLVKERK